MTELEKAIKYLGKRSIKTMGIKKKHIQAHIEVLPTSEVIHVLEMVKNNTLSAHIEELKRLTTVFDDIPNNPSPENESYHCPHCQNGCEACFPNS